MCLWINRTLRLGEAQGRALTARVRLFKNSHTALKGLGERESEIIGYRSWHRLWEVLWEYLAVVITVL